MNRIDTQHFRTIGRIPVRTGQIEHADGCNIAIGVARIHQYLVSLRNENFVVRRVHIQVVGILQLRERALNDARGRDLAV